MAGYLAILSILTVLLAAPLIFGTFAVVPRTDTRTLVVWFGLLTLLLAGALTVSALALLLTLF
ncbi:MAG TPA: hypothetical protein VK066_17950 [Chloroflexota bacterium]|nr:hypothetical protein [Chloroflexota bacterium]